MGWCHDPSARAQSALLLNALEWREKKKQENVVGVLATLKSSWRTKFVTIFEIFHSRDFPLTSPWARISFPFLFSTWMKSSEWLFIGSDCVFGLSRTSQCLILSRLVSQRLHDSPFHDFRESYLGDATIPRSGLGLWT